MVYLARFSLALIFIWFGALKVLGISPVAEVIAQAFPLIAHSNILYTMLAWGEVLLGIGILFPRITRFVGFVMIAHLAVATISVLWSAQAYAGGLPALSMIGEFVIKNLALIALAGMLCQHQQPTR